MSAYVKLVPIGMPIHCFSLFTVYVALTLCLIAAEHMMQCHGQSFSCFATAHALRQLGLMLFWHGTAGQGVTDSFL